MEPVEDDNVYSDQGWNDYQAGKSTRENPYPPLTRAARLWHEAWWDALVCDPCGFDRC